jgi:hypothetical protein
MKNQNANEGTKSAEEKKREIIDLALELSQRSEGFPFPGIELEIYGRMKAIDEEYPGFKTPIDEVIGKCQAEGMKIGLGDHPEAGNVFILPLSSEDSKSDSIPASTLQINQTMDEKLRELILKTKQWELDCK